MNKIFKGLFVCRCIMAFILAVFFQFLLLHQVVAQTPSNITVRGTVVDEADNSVLSGVNIRDNTGKTIGITNEQGGFSITVASGTTVSFAMIGYADVSRAFSSTQTNVGIRLSQSAIEVSDVVVTALGITREERALGYAITTLDSTDVTDAVASNWTESLSGRVAGLNLVRNSGPAASNKIILRGENNLTGDNEALIVIDGVVASSSARRTAAGGSVYAVDGDVTPADFGSALNDLNPEDIASVTVLKGPAASALYGQRGANGAVIITTKSAKTGTKSLQVTYTSNNSWEEINRKPDRQSEFGQGAFGVSYFSYGAFDGLPNTNSGNSAWGAPFLPGSMFYQYDPETRGRGANKTPWVAYPDPMDAFFVTGFESSNSISVRGTLNKVGLRLSANHNDNQWIVPNTGLDRNRVALDVNAKLTDKLTVNAKAQYSGRQAVNMPATGYGNQTLMYWYMLSHPNVNVDWYRDYWDTSPQFEPYTTMVNITNANPESPYAISDLYQNGQRRNGYLGNIQASYKFTKDLSLMVRASGDMNRDFRSVKRPWDAAGGRYNYGLYRETHVKSYEINADFMLKYTRKLREDLDVTASLGGSQMRNEYGRSETRADGLEVPNHYSLDNNVFPLIFVPDTSRYRINSIYAAVSFAYKNYLYLDLTGRQDWNSTLAAQSEIDALTRTDNVGFFYPSASLSFVASDYWSLPTKINFAKFRASIAQVGSGGTTPYRTAYVYGIAANDIYPDSAMTNPVILPNPNLKPLLTTTVELGLDVKLFRNRLTFDVAVYSGNTKNQILNRIVDRSTGYNMQVVNVGRVDNKGLEIAVNGTPYQKKGGLKWTLYGTFTANRNTIKELADSSVVLRTGALGGGQVVAHEGGSMGDLYGRGFVRSPDGQIVFDANTGNALASTDIIYLGNTMPQFRFSVGTGLTYKQVNVKALFDAQFGGVAHSLTFSRLAALGKHTATLPGRYNGIIGDGVIDNGDGTYRKNDVMATNLATYYESLYGSDQAEGSIFRTDYLKFREATVTYAFKKDLIKRVGLNTLNLSVYGRNLFIWSPWPAFDPEFGTISGTDIVQGFETGQLPSTRNYGVRLVVGF